MDEITIGEKVYISSKRAAKITGYAKDYVGQLCREGRVEARLVGRSWYVLESAIREHRFGKPNDVAVQDAPEEPIDRVATWQKPQYVPETPVIVPNLAEKPTEEAIGTPAIADMQTAWREWFAEKKPNIPAVEVTSAEEPEAVEIEEDSKSEIEQGEVPVSNSEDDSSEEMVPVQRVYSETPVQRAQAAKSLDIEPVQSTFAAPNPRTHTATVEILPQVAEQKGSGGLGGAAVRALLVVIMFLSILVGVIGTGHADRFLSGTSIDFGVQSSIIDYLGGTSVYKSSL